MSNMKDLLDPLRYNNLGSYELPDIRSIGGGVFTQIDTLEHLKMLDTIVKAYQSVHTPTFGRLIPQTSSITSGNISSATSTKLITPTTNQVIEVQALDMIANSAGTTISISLQDTTTGGKVLLYDGASAGGALPSGTKISINQQDNNPLPIKVCSGQSLEITTSSSGSVDLDVQAMTTLTQQ